MKAVSAQWEPVANGGSGRARLCACSHQAGTGQGRPGLRQPAHERESRMMTMTSPLAIGAHLSCKDGYLKMAEDAVSIGASTFQFFTRNSHGGYEKELVEDDVIAFRAYADEHGIGSFFAYAPYSVNPASDAMKERDFSEMVLAEDLARMEQTPHQFYALHPGHGMGRPEDEAIAAAAEMMNKVMTPQQTTTVLLVGSAGEGTAICSTFEGMGKLLGQLKLADHAGVCFDTSAAWAAGYDIVNDLDGVLERFDQTVGLDRIREVHLTDSKEDRGSRVDRHATPGQGTIGFEALVRVMEHPKLAGVPLILEIPRSDLALYKTQIEAFKMAFGHGGSRE